MSDIMEVSSVSKNFPKTGENAANIALEDYRKTIQKMDSQTLAQEKRFQALTQEVNELKIQLKLKLNSTQQQDESEEAEKTSSLLSSSGKSINKETESLSEGEIFAEDSELSSEEIKLPIGKATESPQELSPNSKTENIKFINNLTKISDLMDDVASRSNIRNHLTETSIYIEDKTKEIENLEKEIENTSEELEWTNIRSLSVIKYKTSKFPNTKLYELKEKDQIEKEIEKQKIKEALYDYRLTLRPQNEKIQRKLDKIKSNIKECENILKRMKDIEELSSKIQEMKDELEKLKATLESYLKRKNVLERLVNHHSANIKAYEKELENMDISQHFKHAIELIFNKIITGKFSR